MFGGLFKSTRRSFRKRQQPLRTQLTLEGLEERLVPTTATVNVTFANGILTLTNSDSNNGDITITQTASDGYTLTGTNVSYTGQGTTFASGVTGFNIELGSGSDSVDLVGDKSAATQLAGNVIVSSTGALTFTNDTKADFNIGGALEINHTTAGQTLDVELKGQEDSYGSMLVNQGSGDTTVKLFGASPSALVQVAGNVTLNLNGGNNNTTTLGSDMSIAGNLTYDGGTGGDSVKLFGSATDPMSIGGNATMNMGGVGGSDELDIDGAQIQGNLTTSGSGSENDNIFAGATIGGYASLNSSGTGGTRVAVDANGGATSIGSFLSVVTGSGTNNILIGDDFGGAGSTTINGDMGVSIGGGSLSLVVEDANTSIVGNVFVKTGSVSTVNVQIGGNDGHIGDGNGGTIGGYVSINAANASSAVSVIVNGKGQTAGTDQIGGFLSVISGKGNDTIQIDNGATIGSNFGYNLGSGGATVLISGTGTDIAGNVFQMDPGTGVTTNNFGLVAGAVVGGYVSVNSAMATGAAQVVIDGGTGLASSNQIGSYLSVTTGSGNDTVMLNATSIGGSFGFELGAGSDLLESSGDTTVNGAFFGDLGSGNDKMLLQTNLSAVTFAGIAGQVFMGAGESGSFTVNGSMNPATGGPLNFINTGSGNDSVQLGANAGDQFIYAFSQPAVFVGGGGTDTLNTNLANGVSTSTSFPGGSTLQATGFTKLQ